jgi:hypothetical protein
MQSVYTQTEGWQRVAKTSPVESRALRSEAKPPTQPVGGFCFALLKQEGIPLESKYLASVSQLTILFSFV